MKLKSVASEGGEIVFVFRYKTNKLFHATILFYFVNFQCFQFSFVIFISFVIFLFHNILTQLY